MSHARQTAEKIACDWWPLPFSTTIKGSGAALNYLQNAITAALEAKEREIERLRAENEELRKALEPCADRFSLYERGCRDAGEQPLIHGAFRCDIDICRRAAALLKKKV